MGGDGAAAPSGGSAPSTGRQRRSTLRARRQRAAADSRAAAECGPPGSGAAQAGRVAGHGVRLALRYAFRERRLCPTGGRHACLSAMLLVQAAESCRRDLDVPANLRRRDCRHPLQVEGGRGSAALAAGPIAAGLVGSERVRRHPHRRARSAPQCGVSRGPRAYRVRVPIVAGRRPAPAAVPACRRRLPVPSYPAASDNGAMVSQISRNSR